MPESLPHVGGLRVSRAALYVPRGMDGHVAEHELPEAYRGHA